MRGFSTGFKVVGTITIKRGQKDLLPI